MVKVLFPIFKTINGFLNFFSLWKPEWYTTITANKPMKTPTVLCNDPVLNQTDCIYGLPNLNKTDPYIASMYGQQC